VRYYFHVGTASVLGPADTVELEDLEQARLEAARRMGALMQSHPEQIWADEDWRMAVTDEKGLILFIIDVVALASPIAGSGHGQTDGRFAR
jgi:hypothetical protein